MQNSFAYFFYLGLFLISSVLLVGGFVLIDFIPGWVAPIGNKTIKNLVYLMLILVNYISIFVATIFLIASLSLITNLPPYWMLLVIVIFLAYGIKSSYSLRKPAFLMLAGDYSKSLKLSKKNLKKNILIKTHKMNKEVTLYNIALNYHLMGEFKQSTEWLLKIDRSSLSNTFKGVFYGLEAGNLLMLERNINTAESSLETASSLIEMPYIHLWHCYLYLFKNDMNKAKEMIEKYLCTQNNQKYYGNNPRLIIDLKSQDAFANLVIGLYYQAINDAAQAKDYFYKASLCPYDNIYKLKAVAELKKMV
jgi:tetratricopeptide (TPR) repeat protein